MGRIGFACNNDHPTILTNTVWIHISAPHRRHISDSTARLSSVQLLPMRATRALQAIEYIAEHCRPPNQSANEPAHLYSSTFLASGVRDHAEMFGEQKRLNLTRFAKQKAAERLSGDSTLR